MAKKERDKEAERQWTSNDIIVVNDRIVCEHEYFVVRVV